MPRLLSVHPLRTGAVDAHRNWCEELRRRRADFGASRTAAGVTRQVFWVQPDFGLAVVRTDAPDPAASLTALRDSPAAFDRWYARQEQAVHGGALVDAGDRPELLVEHDNGPVDAFDLFVSLAVPMRPGRLERFREHIAAGAVTGEGLARVQRWGIKHMGIWCQRIVERETERDIIVYELVGDIPGMIRSIVASDAPDDRNQRDLLLELYGVDMAAGEVPLPLPALAWSSEAATIDAG